MPKRLQPLAQEPKSDQFSLSCCLRLDSQRHQPSRSDMATDLSNWRDPEHSQWSFRNINKVFSTAPIRKGDKASALPTNSRQFDQFKIQPPNKPEVDLSTFLSQTSTDGFMVLKDGDVVYEYYDRDNDQRSIHIMMSMTKSVTGLVCGILVERGQLELDATISKYIPEVKSTPYDKITVRQCLDMRAGIQVRSPRGKLCRWC